MPGKEYFISGIDTDCGKTYITGLLAYHLKKNGNNIITSKLLQTGCQSISEDILEHRRIMESEILLEDKSGLTCPFVFTYPASPHLAAEIDGLPINIEKIRSSINELQSKYDIILSEGAGGLMVPITEEYLTINYISENNLPLILVSSSKLGSINHTLMSLELCKLYNIELHTLIYNKLPDDDIRIAENSFEFFRAYLEKNFPNTNLIHSESLAKSSGNNAIDRLFC